MVKEQQPQDPGESASPAPTEEQPEEQVEETPEPEEKPEGEEAEADEEAKPEGEEAKAAEPAEAEDKRKRVGGWQRKIEKLERMNEQLVRQLGTHTPGPAPANGKEKTNEEKAAEYIDNLVEQRLSRREQERQAQTAQVEFQRRTAEVRAAMPDFDDVIMSASDVPVSDAVTQALLTSEQGPAIMYALAKSPAELARISALPPLSAAREIGRLEAKLPSAAPAPKTTKPAIRPPVPPTTVNGSTSSTRNLDDLPISEYKRAYRSGRR